jgi:hypothetical protein
MKQRKLALSFIFGIGIYMMISIVTNIMNQSLSINDLTYSELTGERDQFDSFIGIIILFVTNK